jgi:hypothetical protein
MIEHDGIGPDRGISSSGAAPFGLDPGDIIGLDVAPATIPAAGRQIPARNVRILHRLFRVTVISPKHDRSKNITRQ